MELKHLSVLYVEDGDDGVCEHHHAMLVHVFGRFQRARGAEVAQQLLRFYAFDLVVICTTHARESGLELSALIRAELPKLPVVLTSSGILGEVSSSLQIEALLGRVESLFVRREGRA